MGCAAVSSGASVGRILPVNFGHRKFFQYSRLRTVTAFDTPNQNPVLPQLAAGDARAMHECIKRYSSLIWSVVSRSVKDTSSTEDLVQEIFTEIWKKASSFNPAVASEATFVAMIARRRTIDFLRRLNRQPGFETLEAAEFISVPSATSSTMVCDQEAVKSSVASLPEETRQLFGMFFDEGFTHPEIAEKTGLPLGTIKTRLRRGLITLRERLCRVKNTNFHPES